MADDGAGGELVKFGATAAIAWLVAVFSFQRGFQQKSACMGIRADCEKLQAQRAALVDQKLSQIHEELTGVRADFRSFRNDFYKPR